LVLRDAPIETVRVPRGAVAECCGETCAFPQVEHVPSIDHRGHEEDRNVRARGRGSTEAIEARFSVTEDGVLGSGRGAGLQQHVSQAAWADGTNAAAAFWNASSDIFRHSALSRAP